MLQEVSPTGSRYQRHALGPQRHEQILHRSLRQVEGVDMCVQTATTTTTTTPSLTKSPRTAAKTRINMYGQSLPSNDVAVQQSIAFSPATSGQREMALLRTKALVRTGQVRKSTDAPRTALRSTDKPLANLSLLHSFTLSRPPQWLDIASLYSVSVHAISQLQRKRHAFEPLKMLSRGRINISQSPD